MTTEPTLGAMTKVRIGAFATEMAASHPAQAKTIFTLQETLEQRLPVAVQNQIIEKLNRDPKGTLAAAKELINKDPKILDEVNKNPLKLATIMGVSVPATAAPAVATNAPAKPAVDNKVAVAPAATANAPSSGKPAEAKPAPVAVAAAPAAAVKPPISDSELALRTELGKETVKVTKMPGFEEFAARAEKSQSLGQAIDAMMGKSTGSSQEALAALKDIQKDPDFFVKANKGIDEIPVQMRDNVFSQIAENPQLGRQALGGDQGAKMTLTMGAMFGGGGGGFAKLLGGADGGQGMKGFGEMLANLLPKLLEGIKMAFANIFQGNTQFAAAPGVMRMGNEPRMIGRYANSIDTTLGTDSSKKPVIDAANPDKPAMTVSDLRKLEIQQSNKPDATPVPGTPAIAQLDRKLQQGPGQAPGTSFS